MPLRWRGLKICVISETMMTGVGRHVTDVVRAMTARGHEVHLLHSIERCDEALLRELAPSVEIRRRALPMRRHPHWSDVSVLVAIWLYLRRFGPFDIVHGHSSKGGAYARLLSPLLPGRCFYTPHAFITMAPHLGRAMRTIYAVIESCLARVTDTLICVSQAEAEHATRLGIGRRRLAVIPNGIAPFDASARRGMRQAFDLPSDAVIIGFVGRLDEQKGPRILVQAAGEALRRGADVYVAFLGTGPLRAGLEALARNLGIERRLRWAENAPARAWMADFDMVAMPSFYEGFSYVLLEALDAGLPIVSTPVGGIDEVGFIDGAHGYIVPFGDHRALADRLCRLAGDPGLRRRMEHSAREAAAGFSLEKMVDRLEASYREASGAVMDARAPGRAACTSD